MEDAPIFGRRYTYIHGRKWPSEAVDVHDVVVRKRSRANRFLFICLLALFFIGNASYFFLVEEKTTGTLFWSFLLSSVFVKLMRRKSIVKESVVVMATFGVQLETHYSSGRIVRCFVPIGKILKPVLLECVTPVTCYWSLSLILQDEAHLVPVFRELRPPVKMLVPIWKSLCLASGNEESSEA